MSVRFYDLLFPSLRCHRTLLQQYGNKLFRFLQFLVQSVFLFHDFIFTFLRLLFRGPWLLFLQADYVPDFSTLRSCIILLVAHHNVQRWLHRIHVFLRSLSMFISLRFLHALLCTVVLSWFLPCSLLIFPFGVPFFRAPPRVSRTLGG